MEKLRENDYTELELNNMEKLIELSVPCDFLEHHNLQDPQDWDEVVKFLTVYSLHIPWIYMKAIGALRLSSKEAMMVLKYDDTNSPNPAPISE